MGILSWSIRLIINTGGIYMVSGEMKSIIAQNCPRYESRYELEMMSMVSLFESCDNCSNYVRSNCIKDLLNDIKEKVERN